MTFWWNSGQNFKILFKEGSLEDKARHCVKSNTELKMKVCSERQNLNEIILYECESFDEKNDSKTELTGKKVR